MKRALSLLIGTAAITTSALATNGTQLIATTAKARAMGGVGVATYMGAGASNNNPALYSQESGKSVSGGLTFFSPSVTFQDDGGKDTSGYGNSLLPDIGYAHRIDDDMVIGVGLTSIAGSGVDYNTGAKSAAAGTNNSLSILQFSVPFAYDLSTVGAEGLSLGIAPVIQLSTLQTQQLGSPSNEESSADFGINLGLSYVLDKDITLGLVYKTAISSDYGSKVLPYNLDNPSTFGLGINWMLDEKSSVAFDYKLLGYGSAAGYSDYGWSNQHVFALGYERQSDDQLTLRAGFNYGTDIVGTAKAQEVVATYIGFPAVTAAHFTLGAGFDLKESGKIDASFVYGMSFSDSYTYEDPNNGNLPTLVKATNNQTSITVDYTYAF